MAKSTSEQPQESRVYAIDFRPPVKNTAYSIIVYTFIAWLASFFLFAYATAAGQDELVRRGFLDMFLGWLILSALISAGYGLGYTLMRNFAQGQRGFRERELTRLALGEAFLATCGGFGIGFLPISFAGDVLMKLTWTFVVGMLFSFAAILPRYVASWHNAVAEGHGYGD